MPRHLEGPYNQDGPHERMEQRNTYGSGSNSTNNKKTTTTSGSSYDDQLLTKGERVGAIIGLVVVLFVVLYFIMLNIRVRRPRSRRKHRRRNTGRRKRTYEEDHDSTTDDDSSTAELEMTEQQSVTPYALTKNEDKQVDKSQVSQARSLLWNLFKRTVQEEDKNQLHQAPKHTVGSSDCYYRHDSDEITFPFDEKSSRRVANGTTENLYVSNDDSVITLRDNDERDTNGDDVFDGIEDRDVLASVRLSSASTAYTTNQI